jgi:hypothetical protein
MSKTSTKPSFQANPDAAKLANYLRDRNRASYFEMSAAVSRDIQNRDRYVLTGARRILEREGIIFVVERGVGLIRADDAQIAVLSASHPLGKIKRVTQVAQRRQDFVNIQGLTAEQRTDWDVSRSLLSIIRLHSSRAFRNKVEKVVLEQDGGMVDPSTLESMFPSKRRKRFSQG